MMQDDAPGQKPSPSNTEFLDHLAQRAPDGTVLWVNHFVGNPGDDKTPWGGRPYGPVEHQRGLAEGWAKFNTYFSVAALSYDEDGAVHRRKANFARLLVLVADDADPQGLLASPSYVLQTSPGKTQVGIFIDSEDPDAGDVRLVTALVTVMTKRGLIGGDISGNNVVRYVRLPVGCNHKPRPGQTAPSAHRMLHWSPDVSMTLEDAAGVFGLDLDEIKAALASSPASAPSAIAADLNQEQGDKLRDNVRAVIEGNFHEPLNRIAASLVASGAHPGAVTNLLRGVMDASLAPRDERWEARFKDIPRSVQTASEKFQAPAHATYGAQPGDADGAEKKKHLKHIGGVFDETDEVLWLVDGYLEKSCVSMMFGPSGSGKSFVAIDVAACVAAGVHWHGVPVAQGPVLYLAGEGYKGVGRRFMAWQKERGVDLRKSELHVSERGVSLLDEAAAHALIEEIDELVEKMGAKPALIIVDTLARNMGDGDENNTQDMNKFISTVDELMKYRFDCHVMIVHHSGHLEGRARGSSALKAAMDQEFSVENREGIVVFKVTKMKDEEAPEERLFKISKVPDIGKLNRDGEPISGATLKLNGSQMRIELVSRADGSPVLTSEALLALKDGWPGFAAYSAALNCSAGSCSRALKRMLDRGLVSRHPDPKIKTYFITEEAIKHLSLEGFLLPRPAPRGDQS